MVMNNIDKLYQFSINIVLTYLETVKKILLNLGLNASQNKSPDRAALREHIHSPEPPLLNYARSTP
jgi:hypothetical protein